MNAIPYGKQQITDEDVRAVAETLRSDFLTQGPKVKEFEDTFAQYVNAKYAVAVSNGTAALHLCALALGVKPGSKVITTPITFAASANCIAYCGGEIYFVDIDPQTYLMDLNKLEDLLSRFPAGTFSGVIPVDFAGYPVNMEQLRSIADAHGLWILEDACHAPGGFNIDSKGKKQFCGGNEYMDAAIFSFHPVKHITTGEGGMITTNNKELYQKLLMLRTHGITKDASLMTQNHGGWYYEMQELGYNYRMSDIQAALGTSQMDRADWGLDRRHDIAKVYKEAFAELPVLFTHVPNNVYHAYHLFVIENVDRKELYEYLKNQDIHTQVHYIPVHLQPYYQAKGWKSGDFPVSEGYYERCLSLPMYPTLTQAQQEYVINTIKRYFEL